MKITEISDVKKKFVGNLKDPAKQELVDIKLMFKKYLPRHDIIIQGGKGDSAIIETCAPWEDNSSFNLVDLAKAILSKFDHWEYNNFAGDASETAHIRIVRA